MLLRSCGSCDLQAESVKHNEVNAANFPELAKASGNTQQSATAPPPPPSPPDHPQCCHSASNCRKWPRLDLELCQASSSSSSPPYTAQSFPNSPQIVRGEVVARLWLRWPRRRRRRRRRRSNGVCMRVLFSTNRLCLPPPSPGSFLLEAPPCSMSA